MAMVVKNNMSAVSTLNTLNKNSSALQKSLQKVSSGMKINSAQDDASGYAISEKMRVQIRSLDQANQNTQNASSLMKTAEGAVSSTVEILKSLKEKAINAATDTNTDSDRVTIQKELDQFIDQIDDNALTTFNGKYLVDGSKAQSGQTTYTAMTNQSLQKGTDGSTALTALANRNEENLEIATNDKVTVSYVRGGKTHTTTFQVQDKTLGDIFKKAEELEDDQIFADSSHSVVSQLSGSSSTDSTSDSSSSSADKTAYQNAVSNLESQITATDEKIAAKAAELGKYEDSSTTITNGVATTDPTKSYGVAAELGAALKEATQFTDANISAAGNVIADDTDAAGAVQKDASGNFDGNAASGAKIDLSNWDGSELNSTQVGAIDTAIKTLQGSGTEEAIALADKLQTAFSNYQQTSADMVDLKNQKASLEDAKGTVNTALTAITAKETADEKAEGLADSVKTVLDAMAHPGGGVSATNTPLKNEQYVGMTAATNNSGTVTAGSTASSMGQYKNDEDSLSTIATNIANAIMENVQSAATNADTAKKIIAADIATLKTADPGTGGAAPASSAFTGTITWTNASSETTIDTDGDGSADAAANGINSGTLTSSSVQDLNGYGAAYGAYIEAKNTTEAAGFDDKLSDAMRLAGTSSASGGPALLSGKEVGISSANNNVETADGEVGVTVTANKGGVDGQIAGLTISITDSEGNVKKAANAALDQFKTTIFAKNESDANEMTFQVGAAANQSITVGLEDMRSEALGLKGSDGSKVSVATQDKANAAVAVFDNALQKALDQQTTIGAVEARLDYTSQNLTTSSENVQAAESTIRDADMAKEMTNYTKNNVLLQAAQSMLAQANQSSSQVLSLLQ